MFRAQRGNIRRTGREKTCRTGLRWVRESERDRGVLVAAENGGLRRFPRPDLSKTHGLQRRRLRIRPDELVFENAWVGASSGNTADQQIGARRRAGRGDACAGGSVEWLEGGDLAEVRAVVVVERALQIE